MGPPDAIIGLNEAYAKNPSPNKVLMRNILKLVLVFTNLKPVVYFR